MPNNTGRNKRLLAGGVGVTLSLALAVSAGAVPHFGDDGSVRTASVSQIEAVSAPARQPGDTAVEAAQMPVPAAAAAPAVATTAPTAVPKPKVTAPPTTKAPVGAKAAPVTAAPAIAPVAAAPAAPVKVARRSPSPTEVQAGITQLKSKVGGLLMVFPPTPAHIAQAGDQVCTAFDSGQSFPEVKATGLSMIPASVTVTPDTADWAVRQLVTLYCPGHASKLV